MARFAFDIDWGNWNVGLFAVKSEIGTLLKFSFLPLTLIIRIGGSSNE
jgi:hypothetical protein